MQTYLAPPFQGGVGVGSERSELLPHRRRPPLARHTQPLTQPDTSPPPGRAPAPAPVCPRGWASPAPVPPAPAPRPRTPPATIYRPVPAPPPAPRRRTARAPRVARARIGHHRCAAPSPLRRCPVPAHRHPRAQPRLLPVAPQPLARRQLPVAHMAACMQPADRRFPQMQLHRLHLAGRVFDHLVDNLGGHGGIS